MRCSRTAPRPGQLYRESIGPLGHPRGALAALAEARIDVTAIDAYWWWLLQQHDPAAAEGIPGDRRNASRADAPARLRGGFARGFRAATDRRAARAAREPQRQPHLDALGIRRFAAVARADYVLLAELDRAAHAAGYPLPA